MPSPREQPLRFIPRSVSDTVDGDNSPPGACMSLQNLLFAPDTPGVLVCRPANLKISQFAGFTTPGVVSVAFSLGNLIYGLIASGRNAGHDEPFVYNVTTNTFQTVQGITAANTPVTPPSSGLWTPPSVDMVGKRIIVTHPGFNFAGGYAFGYFDISGFTSAPTGTTASGSNIITAVSSTAGISPGYTITGAGIPANTTVTGINAAGTTLTISNNATASATVTLAVAGGTAASPLWAAGNTTGATQLAGVPQYVRQFNNRAYFAQANFLVFTDTLSLNVSNTTVVQVLTVGDSTPITALGNLPLYQTTGGILQALVALKSTYIRQITGDPATNDFDSNELSGTIGTDAPRSVAQTPKGLVFMAADGIRVISLTGEVSEPDPDLAVPFIYAAQPSRVVGCFNADTYRICVQNAKQPNAPYEGYYYDLKRKGWTGPHTFRDDCVVPFGSAFIVFNNALPATIWKSYAVQGHNNEGNSFVENGTQLTWRYETSPITDTGNMYANCAVRSTLDMALPATGDSYVFQATDESRGALALAQFTAPLSEAIWNAFVWGDGTLWGAEQFGLGPQIIPWTQPLIFNKVILQASGNSSLSLKLGSWYVGYERLNFMMQ